jgi:Malate/L-lactate dehydrogenase
MTLGRLRLSVADARDLAEGALRGIGYHNDEARIIADHVIDAAMCGYEYSGLAKILNVVESEHFRLPRRSMKVLRETEVSLAFDGGNNVGMLALFHAAQATIKKTAAHGIALVSVTDAWMSGRGAYYVEMIAKHGLVAIHAASSSRLVAPPGGIRPVLGTNPIAIAVPSSRGPIVLDMGTSAYMMTEVMLRERLGELLPEGVAPPRSKRLSLRERCRQLVEQAGMRLVGAENVLRAELGMLAAVTIEVIVHLAFCADWPSAMWAAQASLHDADRNRKIVVTVKRCPRTTWWDSSDWVPWAAAWPPMCKGPVSS